MFTIRWTFSFRFCFLFGSRDLDWTDDVVVENDTDGATGNGETVDSNDVNGADADNANALVDEVDCPDGDNSEYDGWAPFRACQDCFK